MIWGKDVKGDGRSWLSLRYYPSICEKRLMKTSRNVRKAGLRDSQNMKWKYYSTRPRPLELGFESGTVSQSEICNCRSCVAMFTLLALRCGVSLMSGRSGEISVCTACILGDKKRINTHETGGKNALTLKGDESLIYSYIK